MWGRWAVAAGSVIVLASGLVGYAVAQQTRHDPEPTAFVAQPVEARHPHYPVVEYDVLPDPSAPPLAGSLPLTTAQFQTAGLRMTAQVPTGWRRRPLQGRTSWTFVDPDAAPNTYGLRIGIVAFSQRSLTAERDARILALRDAERNAATGPALDASVRHLVVESEDFSGFTVSYLSHGYLRVSMERWVPSPGSTSAFATIAVLGRDADRPGMAVLLERVASSIDTSPPAFGPSAGASTSFASPGSTPDPARRQTP